MASRVLIATKSQLPKGLNVLQRFKSKHASLKKLLVTIPATERTQLDNGVRIASQDFGGANATVGFWIDVGSRSEDERNNGVSHFLEHLAFKGTEKRSQADLELELENIGAYLNAYTTRETSVFYANCLAKDVPKVVEILADIVQNPKLGEAEIEAERNVILHEVQTAECYLHEVVFDHLHATAYQGTPLGQTILGPTKNIQTLCKSDMADFISIHYKAARVVLAGAGGVKHAELVKLAEENVCKLENTYDGKPPVLSPCRYTGSEVRIRDDSLPLAHVAIAVEGCSWSDYDYIPLMVAKTFMGEWDHTQVAAINSAANLARHCAQDHLCHSFHSFNICYKDTGLWGTYFVCEPMQCEDMIFNIQNEWMRLCIMVTEGEIERVKCLLKFNMLTQLESTTAICEDIGRQMLYHNCRIALHELERRIDAVTVQTVREVCMKYIYDRCPAVVAIGPVESLPDYIRIRSSMYWLRV